ncbi:hypothetical protein TrRE_jg3047 [Triparma retinervis]|uniref:Uncharacterized protein n=1 Tax=Triparma retinervis TaxID=2557542 RepID=A0A9W6ZIN8_9STRA|nr:hypothetical protein TrRE_jg3047 [Triparma retinervis]
MILLVKKINDKSHKKSTNFINMPKGKPQKPKGKPKLTPEEIAKKKAKKLARQTQPSPDSVVSSGPKLTESERVQNELASKMFGLASSSDPSTGPAVYSDGKALTKADFKAQVRVGGSKGSTGKQDHTAGKCQFARPCTVAAMQSTLAEMASVLNSVAASVSTISSKRSHSDIDSSSSNPQSSVIVKSEHIEEKRGKTEAKREPS